MPLSGFPAKSDKYSEERKAMEATQADISKSIEAKSSKKKHKEDIVLTPPETPMVEEPQTYCICGQVLFLVRFYVQPSYGEMIGCDNDNCTIKWFHLHCVGLDTIPEGSWYCPNCRGLMDKSTVQQVYLTHCLSET